MEAASDKRLLNMTSLMTDADIGTSFIALWEENLRANLTLSEGKSMTFLLLSLLIQSVVSSGRCLDTQSSVGLRSHNWTHTRMSKHLYMYICVCVCIRVCVCVCICICVCIRVCICLYAYSYLSKQCMISIRPCFLYVLRSLWLSTNRKIDKIATSNTNPAPPQETGHYCFHSSCFFV